MFLVSMIAIHVTQLVKHVKMDIHVLLASKMPIKKKMVIVLVIMDIILIMTINV